MIIDLMIDRGLVERDSRRGLLRETVAQAPSVDELVNDIDSWQHDLQVLLEAFPSSTQLQKWRDKARDARKITNKQLRLKPNDEQLILHRRSVRAYRRQLENFTEERHKQLIRAAERLVHRLPDINHRQEKALKTSLQGNVDYVQQVNDLRVRIHREFTTQQSKVNQLRQDAESTRAALSTEELSVSTLARLARAVQECEEASKSIKLERKEFDKRFDQFMKWTNLVHEGSELVDDIQMLGDLVEEEQEQFQDLAREIRGHLSADKRKALPYATTYQTQLAEIKTKVRDKHAEVTNRFNAKQQRYLDILKRDLRVPPSELWNSLPYNPVAPADSYNRLYSEVRSVLEKFIAQLRKSCMTNSEAIRATLNSPLVAHLPPLDRKDLVYEGEGQAQVLQELRVTLERISGEIQERKVIEGFPIEGRGSFHELLDSVEEIYNRLQEVQRITKALDRQLQDMELTTEEEKILQTLEAGKSFEVNELRKVASSLTEEQFWRALQGLSAKRQLYMTVTRVRYD